MHIFCFQIIGTETGKSTLLWIYWIIGQCWHLGRFIGLSQYKTEELEECGPRDPQKRWLWFTQTHTPVHFTCDMTEKEWKWPEMRTWLRRPRPVHTPARQRPANNVQTRHPAYQKKGPISRLMSVWLRSIREFMRATSSRPAPERVSPLFTWRYLPNVRFVSITKPRWTGLQHLILQQPFRQFKYILSLHCSDKDQNTNSFP